MNGYLLIGSAAMLFSLQFLFQRQFQAEKGSGLHAAILFSLGANLVICLVMLPVMQLMDGRLLYGASRRAFCLAFLLAGVNIACLYCGLKALTHIRLSVYSAFMMLGGMFLPSLVGILFFHEELNAPKIFCFLLTLAALLLNTEKRNGRQTGMRYCFAAFFLNGMVGVLSKLHQSSAGEHMTSSGFLFSYSLFSVGIVVPILLLHRRKRAPVRPTRRTCLYMGGYGLANGAGNLLSLLALQTADASAQYPLITGGVLLFSLVIGWMAGERPTRRGIGTLLFSLAAVFILMCG